MFTFKLYGRVTRDPEVRNLKDGQSITTLSVACPIAKGKEVGVMFADLKAWSPLGDRLAGMRKGQRVFAEGQGITDKYDKDGKTHYRTAYWPYHVQIEADNEEASSSGSRTPVASGAPGATPKAAASDEDDVPF